jgi:hypothetical protein
MPPVKIEASAAPLEQPLSSLRSLASDPGSAVGRRCCKRFEADPSKLYYGTIATFLPRVDTFEPVDMWHVKYDDGDSEDWDADAVVRGLSLILQHPEGVVFEL